MGAAAGKGTLLLDAQTFYGRISLAKLMELAIELKYPAIAVGMEVQLYFGLRALRDARPGVRDTLAPTRSVVAV